LLHSYLETQVEVPGTDWENEVFQDDELVGRYDCHDQLDGVVYEFKSKNERGMRRTPYQEDIEQIEEYLDALDRDVGFLIYIDRAAWRWRNILFSGSGAESRSEFRGELQYQTSRNVDRSPP
jgi:hypothetical protein